MSADKPFDELEYTEDRMIKTLLAIENHAKDGSALEGCTCLQGKHFYELEEYAEEGITIATREKEKAFYEKVAPAARELRKAIVDGTFEFPTNPFGREYLPHGLTKCEKAHPEVVHRLASCIKDVEEREHCFPPYEHCAVNPVAVCRASVQCP